jgi:hypothetical protein
MPIVGSLVLFDDHKTGQIKKKRGKATSRNLVQAKSVHGHLRFRDAQKATRSEATPK